MQESTADNRSAADSCPAPSATVGTRQAVDLSRLPQEILTSEQAVLWRYEYRDGKLTKVPYQPYCPSRRAAVNDPATLGSFESALAALEGGAGDGVGVVLGRGLIGIDLDRCRDADTGVIQPAALDIVRNIGSYTEISPSGTGVHVFAHGSLPPGRRRLGDVEMYADGRFFTVTGRHLEGTPTTIEERTTELAAVHARAFGTNGHGQQLPIASSPSPPDDAALIARACGGHNGAKFSRLWHGDTSAYSSSSEADLALCNLLAFQTGSDASRVDRLFRRSALMRPKWDERRGAQTYGELTIGRAIGDSRTACESGNAGVRLQDFHAVMPMHSYLFAPARDIWPASSVNARIGRVALRYANGEPMIDQKGQVEFVTASGWLDTNRPVEQLTWMPGLPDVIADRLVSEGGWIHRPGCRCFNLYRPPQIELGDPGHVDEWTAHITRVYPDAVGHIVAWLAHRVQRPHEKINHALVLGGAQGIGKDTILAPVKAAVGPWNFAEVSPAHLLGRFNGFVKSVILRVSEARDLGDVDRYSFYDHLKIYTAAPPDVLRVDEKNLREYSVWNVCGVVITTNHKDGLYLPADDRRHYVAWSGATKDQFDAGYWTDLYRWYVSGGERNVAAYLTDYDLSGFDPKAPPPKTDAFMDMVDLNRAPEDAELADVLEKFGNPSATTLAELANGAALTAFGEWLRDRRNARQIPHRMEDAGYVAVRNPDAHDGLWRVGNRRQVIYVRHELSPRDRLAAARGVVTGV